MPRQNRVDPFGGLVATECRGTLMGNRGCLHDEERRIRRAYALRRWIFCVLEFRGRHRQIMAPGRYTELFFLDEATALAAGHRPCAECQRERYLQFRQAWLSANAGRVSGSFCSVDEIDDVLHGERLAPGSAKRTWRSPLAELPAGVMIVGERGVPFLVLSDRLLPWSACGYGPGIRRPASGQAEVLTPPSTVGAMAAGFVPTVHASAR